MLRCDGERHAGRAPDLGPQLVLDRNQQKPWARDAALEAVRGEWLHGLLEGDDQVRQRRGGQRELLVPAAFGPADVHAEAAGDGKLRTPHVRAAFSALSRPVVSVRKKWTGSSSGMVPARWDDIADVVATAEGQKGVPVGDVEGFHADRRGTTGRRCGGAWRRRPRVRGRPARERCGRQSCQPSGDEDHRHLVVQLGHAGCRDDFQRTEIHVRRALLEEAAAGAQPNGDLVEDHLVDESAARAAVATPPPMRATSLSPSASRAAATAASIPGRAQNYLQQVARRCRPSSWTSCGLPISAPRRPTHRS